MQNFRLKKQYKFFGTNLPKKCISGQKQKSERYHQTQQICVGINIKFYHKQTIFLTKFTIKNLEQCPNLKFYVDC